MASSEEGGTPLLALQYRLDHERQPFNRDEVRRLPKGYTGVYAFWLPAGTAGAHDCLYVGMSETCVRTRLMQHITNETNPGLRRELAMFRDVVLFSVAFTSDVGETRALESAVIRAWQPRTNRAGVC